MPAMMVQGSGFRIQGFGFNFKGVRCRVRLMAFCILPAGTSLLVHMQGPRLGPGNAAFGPGVQSFSPPVPLLRDRTVCAARQVDSKAVHLTKHLYDLVYMMVRFVHYEFVQAPLPLEHPPPVASCVCGYHCDPNLLLFRRVARPSALLPPSLEHSAPQ